MSDHPLSRPLQVCAAVVLILTILCALVFALGADRVPPAIMTRGIPVALCVAGGFGLCGVLLALMGMLDKNAYDPQARKLLTDIRDQLSRLNSTPMSTPPADGAPASPMMQSADASRIVQLLDEIRDISLLDEQQKKARLERLLAIRRQTAAATVDAMVQQQRWAEARAALQQAQMLFGDGPELQAMSNRLLQAIAAAESTAFAEMQKKVSEHQAADNWDQAVAESQSFVTQFPDSAPGIEFHTNLVAARAQWVESTANRLYEEVRQAIEQRAWRRALGTAQRLMTKCPGHERAKKVEFQMQIIRENADTEQRNAMEARIHELVKAQRLKDAIDVAEDLIRAYPLSPQAQIASQLILKLQEHLEQAEAQPA